MLLYVYVIVACVCVVVVVPVVVVMALVVPPPLVLFAPAHILLLAVPRDVLGKAFVPLHHRGVAEPELLLCSFGGVRACAGNISPRRPRHCLYHPRRCRRCCRRPQTEGVPPTIAPYTSVVVLLLVIVVLAPHCLEPTPTSVVIAVIIGAPPEAI